MTAPEQAAEQQTSTAEVLTCPECVRTYSGSLARIGNRKTTCRLCNRFAQTVRRAVARALMDAHPDEVAVLRARAEQNAYGTLVGSTDDAAGEQEDTP